MFLQIMDVIADQKKNLTAQMLTQVVQQVANCCLQYSSNASTAQDESFRKATKKDLLDLVEKLELLLLYTYKQSNKDGVVDSAFVYQMPEVIHLNFALRFLQLHVLEKKIIGGTMLIMKVLQVKKSVETNVATKWLDKDRLVQWLDSVNIFNVFFGGSLHPEVIKKSFYLLNFLYTTGRIAEPQIAQMWHVATKKHEAFRAVILKALAFLSGVMKPKELKYLFEKLKSLPLKDQDKFSLGLIKAIAKALAPNKGMGLVLNKTVVKENNFVQNDKPKRRQSLDAGSKPNDTMMLDLNLTNKVSSYSPTNAQKPSGLMGLMPEQGNKVRKQRSLSPDPKPSLKEIPAGFKEDIFNAWQDDPEEIELQKTLALSLQDASKQPTNKFSPKVADSRPARMQGDGLITNENLFDVPEDKEDKRTADEEQSPNHQQCQTQWKNAILYSQDKPQEAASQALDLPQPKAQARMDQLPWKPSDFDSKEKSKITNYFYFDQSLGLFDEDPQRKELALEVLSFMWNLCLDEAVFGIMEQEVQVMEQFQQKKGISVQNHQLCIEQFVEVINYNYPHAWFQYIFEAARRLKANMQAITMQLLLKKMLIGVQFPMLDKPPKPVQPKIQDDATQEEHYTFKCAIDKFDIEQQQYEDQLNHIAALPRNRTDLIQTLEEELSLTSCCLSSYIQFKRTSLQLIYQHNFANSNQVEQDDNMETQSSLDGEESVASSIQNRELINTVSFKSSQSQTQKRSKEPSEKPSLIYDSGDGDLMEETKEEFKQSVRRQRPNESRSFLDSMVTNQIYNFSFQKEMTERLDFLRFLVTQNPSTMVKYSQIQVLWESLVSNAFYEKERDQFFIWCNEVLKIAQKKQQLQFQSGKYDQRDKDGEESIDDLEDVFSEDCLELIYFETLLKLDFRHFTPAIYNCFECFFIHINEQYGQIVTGVYESQLEVFQDRLIGMEALWEILLQARDQSVHKKALEFIQRLYKRMNSNYFQENLIEIKMNLLEICNDNIKKGQRELTDNQMIREVARGAEITHEDSTNRVSRSINLLSKFIEDFEGFKNKSVAQKTKIQEVTIALRVNNMVAQTFGPKKFDLSLPETTTIEQIKNQLASSIFPKRPVRELSLLYKGRELNENLKTLKQVMGSSYNPGQTQPVIMILSSKSELEMEFEEINSAKQAFDPVHINNMVQELKEFLGGTEVSDDVIALALKKNNLDMQEAIGMVVDDALVLQLQQEIEREQEARAQQDQQNMMIITQAEPDKDSQPQEDKLNVIISNKAEYFDLLFDLLNLGNSEITSAVWSLLMQVPVNQQLLQNIKQLTEVQQIESSMMEAKEFIGWSQIVDPGSTYKMLYSLQILNTLISVNNERLSENEVQERFEWRQRFLELGGFNHLYSILITSDVQDMLSCKVTPPWKQKSRSKLLKIIQVPAIQSKSSRNDQARCLAYLISIIKVFLQAALLTVDQENLLSLIVQSSTSPFNKVKAKQVGTGGENKKQGIDQLLFFSLAAANSNAVNQSSGNQSSSSNTNSGIQTPTFQNQSSGYQTPPIQSESKTVAKDINIGVQNPNTFTQVDDFPRLVEQMKVSNIATYLLDKVVDFKELVKKLLSIIHEAVLTDFSQERQDDAEIQKEQKEQEQLAQLLQHSVDLLLPCVVWQPQFLKEIQEFEGLETLLVRSLLHNRNESARKAIERAFRIICTQKFNEKQTSIKTQILKLLLRNLPAASEQNNSQLQCEEYFNLLATLIKSCQDNFTTDKQFNFKASLDRTMNIVDLDKFVIAGDQFSAEYLLEILVSQLYHRPILENKSDIQTDRILVGYLQIIQALLESSPIHLRLKAGRSIKDDGCNLVQTIFDFLCKLPKKHTLKKLSAHEDVPKCKSRLSRKRAFKLLLTLTHNCIENYTQLLERLYFFHESIQSATKTVTQEQLQEFFTLIQSTQSANASSTVGVRSAVGYVGLKNFGCTCYMNSLMQQLFMIPEFRAGILKVHLQQLQDQGSGNVIVVQEIQKIFANLQESEKQFYKPQGFVDAFQFYGEPVNVRQQQDTNEFFNILCEYIENCSPETAQVLKRSLGGVIVNETKSLEAEYPYIGEKEEPFFALALDIKDKKSLQEALDLYIKPDILEGDNKYQCDKYGNRLIDAQRRTYIKKLPPTVVINLKRFEFNLHTMERIKINEYCEFPETIDMRPWTKEGIQEREKQNQDIDQNLDVADTKENGYERIYDAEMDDLGSNYDKREDKLSAEEIEDDQEEPCSNFSENDAIESEEYEFELEIQQQPQQEKRPGFEELIGYTQEDDDQLNPSSKKNKLDEQLPSFKKQRKRNQKSQKRENRSGTDDKLMPTASDNATDNDAIMSSFSGKQAKSIRSNTEEKIKPKRLGPSRDTKFIYQLVGVLVHSGSANSGHYYSYIKERKEFVGDDNERWLEFNDTNVTEFDKNKLAQECFGTQPRQQNQQQMWERHCNAYLLFYERVSRTSPKFPKEEEIKTKPLPLQDNQNLVYPDESNTEDHEYVNNIQKPLYKAIWAENQAFIKLKLFFDVEYLQFVRDFVNIFKSSGFMLTANEQLSIEPKSSLYFAKHHSESERLTKIVEFTERLNEEQQRCEDSNQMFNIYSFLLEYNEIVKQKLDNIFDVESKGLVDHLKSDLGLYTLKFATVMSFDIALKMKDVNGFVQWVQLLDSLFERNANACVWLVKYMTENKETLCQLLLEHNNFEVRESFSRMLKTALCVTAKNEETYFFETVTYKVPSEDKQSFIEVKTSQSSVIRFMEYFFGEMFDVKVRENWRRYEEYFDVLKDFINQNFYATKFIVQQRGIYRLIEFLMNRKGPFADDKKLSMGAALAEPQITQPLDLVSFLTKCTFTNGIASQNKYAPTSVYQDEERKLLIPVNEINYLLKEETLNEILRKCSDSHSEDAINALAGIVAHLSWGDRNVSQFFVRQLLNYLERQSNDINNNVTQYDVTLRVLFKLISLQDSDRQLERFRYLFDLNFEYVDSKPLIQLAAQKSSSNPVFSLYILKFVVESASQETKLRNYLRLFANMYKDWVLEFLAKHRESSAQQTPLKPVHETMLTQVSQKVCELLSLEYDFAIDFEQKEQADVVMQDQGNDDRAFGVQNSFKQDELFDAANLGEDLPDSKMFQAVNIEEDYFISDSEKNKKDQDNSMNVEVDDYSEQFFDDEF